MQHVGMASSLAHQGFWLFRWRSYLPASLIPLFLIAILQGSVATNGIYFVASMIVAYLGLACRCFIVGHVPDGTSGRNTKQQIADVLNQTGAYSLVRHPLYVANFIIFFGLLLQVQSLWLCLVASLAYWMYYERIICAEEHFLHGKFNETFRQWASRTPAVVPNFSNWCKPSLPFSWKMVLRREYSTLFLVICAQVAIVIVRVRDVSAVSQYWLLGCYFAVGASVYFGLRWLKKNTACLYVPPRG